MILLCGSLEGYLGHHHQSLSGPLSLATMVRHTFVILWEQGQSFSHVLAGPVKTRCFLREFFCPVPCSLALEALWICSHDFFALPRISLEILRRLFLWISSNRGKHGSSLPPLLIHFSFFLYFIMVFEHQISFSIQLTYFGLGAQFKVLELFPNIWSWLTDKILSLENLFFSRIRL